MSYQLLQLLSWFLSLIFSSGPGTFTFTNSELSKYNSAAMSVLKELSQTSAGFSFWTTPRFFVANEKEHQIDGLHFAWPGTIFKVNMVIFDWCRQSLTRSPAFTSTYPSTHPATRLSFSNCSVLFDCCKQLKNDPH